MRALGLAAVGGAEIHRKGMLKQSENIVHRLFTRQVCRARPNTHIHQARKLYENIVPSHTVYDVECPDHSFRKFTNDGQYLICFSRSHQELIVYRHKWLNFCVKGDSSDHLLDLPPKSRRFESYFSQLYTVSLATGSEVICKDFFLSTENSQFGVFATSTLPDNSGTTTNGAVPGIPSTEKITILLVSLADGQITDERVYHDDFIHLAHNMGVFLYDDLLAILSIRFQSIRILQIRETGRFVDVRTIGAHCREDDELVLNSQSQEEEFFHNQQASIRKARGLPSQVEISAAGRGVDIQGNAWPPMWKLGMKHPHPTRNWHRSRSHVPRSSIQAPSWIASRQLGGASGGADDSVNGSYSRIHESELDIQYENYFRGLFASFEDNAVTRMDTVLRSGTGTSSVIVQGSSNSSRQEGETVSPLRILASNGHYPGGVELRAAYAPIDSISRSLHSVRNPDGSTSGSGGHYSSAGLSHYRRSYTSTSGDSLDRYTTGRGSPSVRYTSTTVTSSDSGTRSESNRRDASGGSMSYETGPGGNGSVSIQSGDGNSVEYVVSSRIQQGMFTVPEEPIFPIEVGREVNGRTTNRTLRENGHSFTSNGETSAGDGNSLEQGWTLGPADEGNDRTIPVGFPGERNTTVSDRALPQAGVSSRGPVPVRDSHNGNRVRVGTDVTQLPARSGHEGENGSGGGVHRHRRASDADICNEGGGREGSQLLGGIKQRLLSFIYQGVWNEDLSAVEKAQRLKRFYYHFQHYVDLVMWKVQFLDRYHLLIKFGSVDGVLQRNSDTSHQTAFLAVYNLEKAEMVGFYQNSSEEFLLSFEQFCDHYRVPPRYPLYMNFISSYSNNSHVRDQLRKQRLASSSSKAGSHTQVVKRTLAWLPFNSQCQSPSVYFDQSLFHYDEKLISAMDRHKPCMEHPIKFISKRRPNSLKFKINPGPELGTNDGRTKRVVSFIFHPIFPFAMSIQQSFMQPPIVNFHFRK